MSTFGWVLVFGGEALVVAILLWILYDAWRHGE